MEVETLDRRTIGPADARAIAELIISIWPKPGRTIDGFVTVFLAQFNDYRGPEAQQPRSFLVRENGQVVAHASALPRTIGTPQGQMTVLALARVCTNPAVRGRKLGEAVVRAAFALVDHGAFPFSLFQTSPSVKPFYERLGAVAIDNRFVNSLADDPTANPFWEVVTMRYSAGPGWPDGQIDLLGPGW